MESNTHQIVDCLTDVTKPSERTQLTDSVVGLFGNNQVQHALKIMVGISFGNNYVVKEEDST